MAFKYFQDKKAASFFFSTVDHACVVQLKDVLESFGHKVFFFGVNRDGIFNSDELIRNIKEEKAQGREAFINFTYINNETGVLWPLTLAERVKEETNAFIHIDAVQIVGKLRNWRYLSPKIDAYTFSGHKFGSLKGVGFSFVRKDFEFSPLLVGGGQQSGLRAGTENALGIYSLKLALKDIRDQFNPDELLAAKNLIESKLIALLGEKGEIVALGSPNRNLNTIFLVVHGQKAEVLSAKFDLSGMDVSTGSACSSGIIKENRILMSMGYDQELSRSAIRLSFSPFMTINEAEVYFKKIEMVLKNL